MEVTACRVAHLTSYYTSSRSASKVPVINGCGIRGNVSGCAHAVGASEIAIPTIKQAGAAHYGEDQPLPDSMGRLWPFPKSSQSTSQSGFPTAVQLQKFTLGKVVSLSTTKSVPLNSRSCCVQVSQSFIQVAFTRRLSLL